MREGGGQSRRFIVWWLGSALVLFALMLCWAFATPLGAASDEPAQIVKAAAVARGEFLGQPTAAADNADPNHSGRAVMTVIVPATYARSSALAACYRHREKVTAACAPGASPSGQMESATTYVGRYPPLYYLLVGSPSLVWHSSAGIYGMRMLSSLLSSLLVGLALASAAAWGRRRLLVGGVAVALTPMVVFLASVVNPSGLEIAASIAVWTTGLVLVADQPGDPPTGLIVAFFASACVLVATRSLSPLWLALIVLTLVCLEPRGCRDLLRRRAVRTGVVVTAMVGVLSVVYIVTAQALAITASGIPLKANATVWTVVNLYQARSSFYISQTVGVFGWLDTSAPFGLVFLVGLVIVGLVWLAFASAARRHVVVLVGLLVAALVIPVAIDVKNALQLHSDVWQSRYAMPLYVGVPLVAAAIAGGRKAVAPAPGRRIVYALAVVMGFAQWVCFYVALHRYTVGFNGPAGLSLKVAGGWTPPLPAAVLLGAVTVVLVGYVVLVMRLGGTRMDDPAPPGGDGSPSTVADLREAAPVAEPA